MKDHLHMLVQLLGPDKVEYHASVDIKPQPKSICILDEADEFVFQQTIATAKLLEKAQSILLTATPDDRTSNEFIGKHLLKLLRIKCFDVYKTLQLS